MNRLRSAVCHGRRFWTSASSIAQPGQFGLPGLHSARDWERIALQCVKCCENAAEKIRATSNDPTIEVLQLFDDLSNDICTVLDTCVASCTNVPACYISFLLLRGTAIVLPAKELFLIALFFLLFCI